MVEKLAALILLTVDRVPARCIPIIHGCHCSVVPLGCGRHLGAAHGAPIIGSAHEEEAYGPGEEAVAMVHLGIGAAGRGCCLDA